MALDGGLRRREATAAIALPIHAQRTGLADGVDVVVLQVLGCGSLQGGGRGMPLGNGLYAVVPNPFLVYGEEMHMAGGMREAVNSNYRAGNP